MADLAAPPVHAASEVSRENDGATNADLTSDVEEVLIHPGHPGESGPRSRLAQGAKVAYARDDSHKEQLLKGEMGGRGKVEVSRFKGLGEMLPAQLKETTMDPVKRTLLRVSLDDAMRTSTAKVVEQLMGNKPEERFNFISERAAFVSEEGLDI